jgi:hypothetical protein
MNAANSICEVSREGSQGPGRVPFKTSDRVSGGLARVLASRSRSRNRGLSSPSPIRHASCRACWTTHVAEGATPPVA